MDLDPRANARERHEPAGADLEGLGPTLERVVAGDLGALALIYRAYAERVYRLAYRLTRSVQDAQDIVQDLFLALPETLERYRGRGFDTWLRAVTARVALQTLRVRQRRREVALDPDWLVARPPRHGMRIDLEAAVAALPEALRVVVVLKEIEGFSHAEIGELLGITADASATRLRRAREHLRRALD